MRIKRIVINNFGVFKGEHKFDLTSRSNSNFTRPIVLIVGKNGVGKTTIVEAIRLGLHGPLVLGSKVGQVEFEEYLHNKIHRTPGKTDERSNAKIELEFDFVKSGNHYSYCVIRSWGLQREKIHHQITIIENDKELDLESGQKENFLRELVSPTAADLFFFDGEQLQNFMQGITNNAVISRTVKSLLGLNLVKQLQKDLDVFISRAVASNGANLLKAKLRELNETTEDLENEHVNILYDLKILQGKIKIQKDVVTQTEERISKEGGWYASKYEEMKSRKNQLVHESENIKQEIREMFNGLLPFAIAPSLLDSIQERFDLERQYEQQEIEENLTNSQIQKIKTYFANDHKWEKLKISEKEKGNFIHSVERILVNAISKKKIKEEEIIFGLSEQKRIKLQVWIDQASYDLPVRFCKLAYKLQKLEKDLDRIQEDINKATSKDILKPLVLEINQQNRKLGSLLQRKIALENELEELNNKLEYYFARLRKTRERIAELDQHNERVKLASKTQSVLEEYTNQLTKAKVTSLAQFLVYYFNKLCRKKDIIDNAEIDPEDFSVTLYREFQAFDSSDLSAGEKQLFAISMIWALHSVSGLPIPVIIDTPLARLDKDHRSSMVNQYLPRVSHQVIVLATDAEIDKEVIKSISPNVSHGYSLVFNENQASTNTSLFEPGKDMEDQLERIKVL